MVWPKSRDPRTEILSVRLTRSARERVAQFASASGQSVASVVQGLCLTLPYIPVGLSEKFGSPLADASQPTSDLRTTADAHRETAGAECHPGATREVSGSGDPSLHRDLAKTSPVARPVSPTSLGSVEQPKASPKGNQAPESGGKQ
jgi:hypothetical protein